MSGFVGAIRPRRGFFGLGQAYDPATGMTEIPPTDPSLAPLTPGVDYTYNTDMSLPAAGPSPWLQSLITGAVNTAERIGLQQTVPAGTYTRLANGTIMYQQPTQGPAASAAFSLPGAFTTAGGSSMLWLALLAIGGIVVFRAVGGGR